MWKYNYGCTLPPDTLEHHGVLGMKWGHRKAKAPTNSTLVSNKRVTKSNSDSDVRRNVKEYSKKYDKAEKASNIADKKWHEVNEMYVALGKNKVQRIINASRNKSTAAKKYNNEYDRASNMSDEADALWKEAKDSYKKTGRNRISRVINNAKYSR